MSCSKNFEFLRPCCPQLVVLGNAAERQYSLNEPVGCLVFLRTYIELLVDILSVKLHLYHISEYTLREKIDRIEARCKAQENYLGPDVLFKAFHRIRLAGNRAVHQHEGSLDKAVECLQIAQRIGVWYYRSFHNPDFVSAEFLVPEPLVEFDPIEAQAASQELQEYESKIKLMQAEIDELHNRVQVSYSGLSNRPGSTASLIDSIINDIDSSKPLEDVSPQIEGFDQASALFQTAETILRRIATLIGQPLTTEFTLTSGEEILPGLGMVSDAAMLSARADDIHQGIFKLIVIGEFKHGKSTLLNAMLGAKVLPVAPVPATAIITMLVWGENQQVEVYEVGQEQPRIVSLEDFNQEFRLSLEDVETINSQGFLDRFRNIQYAKIESSHHLCSKGIRLIDSPGLAEQVSRTRIATDFFEQSQASIFVLYAKQQLSEGERQFIKTHFKPGFVDHVFFVVNQIDLIDEEEVDEVKDYFRSFLKDFFLDSTGKPDLEKCNRHLFFTNAKAALKARQADSVKQDQLEESGILELEKALEKFLASTDKVKAGLSSSFKLLISIICEAYAKVEREKLALEQTLVELEQRRIESEVHLTALEKRKSDIQETIRLYSEVIATKLCANLEQHIQDMRSLWMSEAQSYINAEVFNPINLAKILVDSSARDRLKDNISSGVQSYLEEKFTEWAGRVPLIVEDELNRFSTKLENEIETFVKELVDIENLFSGEIFDVSISIEELSRNRSDKILQVAVGLAMMDFSGLSGTLMGRGNWISFVQATIVQAAIGTFIFSIFQGPVGIVAFIVVEVIQFFRNHNRHEREILSSMGQKIHDELNRRSPEMRTALTFRTKECFWNVSDKLVQTLQQQIDEVRTEQERILEQKRSKGFSVESERLRLEKISEELVILFNTLSEAVYGRVYTLEQLKWLATGKKVLGES